MPERGGAMQDCTDVPLRTWRHRHVHGAVTGTKDEAGGSVGGRAQLLFRPTETLG